MTRTMKIMTGALVSGLLAGLLMLAFGLGGPTYRTKVLTLPVNLQLPSEHQARFAVDHNETYELIIYLKKIFSKEKMDKILGSFVDSGGGEIDLSWEVKVDDSVVARGSNAGYGYSPLRSDHVSGLTIGTFTAEKNKDYSLSVFTNNANTDWNEAGPYIEVRLHPAKLEGYMALQIFGFIIAFVFGLILLIVMVLHFINKPNSN